MTVCFIRFILPRLPVMNKTGSIFATKEALLFNISLTKFSLNV